LRDLASEALLLMGTAHIRLAERGGKGSADDWRRAREYLERAEQAIPEKDRDRLTYRLAKVGFHTGVPPEQVIKGLQESIESAENQVEGYDLLTRAYLRLNPPDLAGALEANKKLREVPEITEAAHCAAKLTGGELLLQMGKPEEARKDLEKIGPKAPPAILVRALLLRARSFQDEKQWAEASRLYTNALADSRAQVPHLAQVYYNLGLCYYKLDQPQEAADEWQKCVRLARGDEGPAAAMVLAGLRLLEAAPDKALSPDKAVEAGLAALEALNKAVEGITSAERWHNPLLDLARARDVFERAIDTFKRLGRYDLALKVLTPYARIGDRRRLLVREGELAGEWARLRQDKARDSTEPVADTEKKEIRDLCCLAARAFGQAADLPGLSAKEQGEYLWQSIPHHLAAEENDEAARKLRRLVRLDLPPARLGEAWYRLGEECRAEGNADEATTAYRESMKYDTRFAYLARYQLAMAALRGGDRDEAEAALVTNRKLLTFEPDAEALSLSLFALGNILYQRRDYRRAARYLEDALNRFKDHPETTRGRYQLADSYRQIAAQENQSFLLSDNLSEETKAHLQKEHRRWLQKAADEFAALDAFLEKAEKKPGPSPLTAEQRAQVPFITAKCWFNLGEYQKGLKVYERLIDRHAEQVKLLIDALGGAVTCHAALGQVDKVRWRLLQIKKALPDLPASDRGAWEQWLEEALKGLQGV
jgi:tetratricopeptide (TPR) repeat protein